jgi:hypothetical protein
MTALLLLLLVLWLCVWSITHSPILTGFTCKTAVSLFCACLDFNFVLLLLPHSQIAFASAVRRSET